MTQLWNDAGRLLSGTIIFAEPNILDKFNDKSALIQKTTGKLAKAQSTIAKKHNIESNIWIKEFPNIEADDKTEINVSDFNIGDKIKISGVTKGKGWTGAMKRHGFHGGPASHGGDSERGVGSIGNQQPQRVVKGTKMSGRMGGDNLTVRGSKIIAIYPDKNLIVVSGAVPGPRKSKVVIQTNA